jgi:outer membrane protease
MKIVYAFALFVSICMGSFFPVLSYGQDSFDFAIAKTPYRISLSAGAGTLIGQAEEIVYKYADRDDTMSLLLWDLKPMVYLGSALSFSRQDLLAGPGLALDLSVKFGLPLQSGTMEDRDWYDGDLALQYPGNPRYGLDNPDLKCFSAHDAYLEKGTWLLDVSGGISIPVKSKLALKALLGFSYMQFSWFSQDGYTEYMRDNWERIYYKEPAITYDQAWLILSAGIGLFLPLGRSLSMDLRFFISPLVYAGGEDHHIKRKRYFNDYMRGGLFLEPALDIAFAPNNFFSIVARGSWRRIFGTRGNTFLDGSFLNENQAGAGFSAFDAGLSFKFALPFGLLGKKKQPEI